MSESPLAPPPGWYPAQGDPPGTQRYWNGSTWEGEPQPVPGFVTTDSFPLAGLPQRMLARLIDLVCWVVLFALARGVTALLDLQSFGAPLGYLLVVGYEAYLIGTTGATIGKRMVDLVVVETDGSPASLLVALRRTGLLIAMILLSAVPIIGTVAGLLLLVAAAVSAFMIYSDDKGQTIWDRLGPTLVVTR